MVIGMRCSRLRAPCLAGALLMVFASPGVPAQGRAAAPPADAAPGRFIVKLRAAPPAAELPTRMRAVAHRAGATLREARHIVSGMQLLQVQMPAGPAAEERTLARLR